ncbi:MAG: transcriptional repressor [Proteobacteria bacterium]|nr:transcriptional repressor [Pseudomonadota bacterium]
MQVLEESNDHPTVSDIHRRVTQKHHIALGTTYRILNRLTAEGVLRRCVFGDDKARYEPAGSPHYHLIDHDTGAIVEVSDDRLTALLKQLVRGLGYRMIACHVEIIGEIEDNSVRIRRRPRGNMVT